MGTGYLRMSVATLNDAPLQILVETLWYWQSGKGSTHTHMVQMMHAAMIHSYLRYSYIMKVHRKFYHEQRIYLYIGLISFKNAAF